MSKEAETFDVDIFDDNGQSTGALVVRVALAVAVNRTLEFFSETLAPLPNAPSVPWHGASRDSWGVYIESELRSPASAGAGSSSGSTVPSLPDDAAAWCGLHDAAPPLFDRDAIADVAGAVSAAAASGGDGAFSVPVLALLMRALSCAWDGWQCDGSGSASEVAALAALVASGEAVDAVAWSCAANVAAGVAVDAAAHVVAPWSRAPPRAGTVAGTSSGTGGVAAGASSAAVAPSSTALHAHRTASAQPWAQPRPSNVPQSGSGWQWAALPAAGHVDQVSLEWDPLGRVAAAKAPRVGVCDVPVGVGRQRGMGVRNSLGCWGGTGMGVATTGCARVVVGVPLSSRAVQRELWTLVSERYRLAWNRPCVRKVSRLLACCRCPPWWISLTGALVVMSRCCTGPQPCVQPCAARGTGRAG